MWEGNRGNGGGRAGRVVLSNTRRVTQCFKVFPTGVLKQYFETGTINAFTTGVMPHRINLQATVKYTYI
jgi:hypothetical protein